ncbi:MAG: ATP-dependent zinc metalloprotease FtsH [Bacilli bacterium]
MNKRNNGKKSILPQLLMSIVTISLIGFMIWFFVNMSMPKAKILSRNEIINQNGDSIVLNIKVLSVNEEYDGRMVKVSGYYTEADVTSLQSKNIVQYTFTMNYDEYMGVNGGSSYKVDENKAYIGTTDKMDTTTIPERTIHEYMVANMSFAVKDYANAGEIANSNVYGKVTQGNYKPDGFITWLPTIIFTLLFVVGGYFLIKMFMGSVGGSNKQAMDYNKSRARRVENSKIRFKDVAGCDEEKAEMVELVDYLKAPAKYTKAGAKLPRGVLLVGAPGTGKTLLAKAVAGEAGVPFFSVSGSDFVEMFVGVGAGRVRDLFKTAKLNAPCLVFIDEIDAVGRQRGTGMGGGNDEREQTLNQLLVEMDGFADNSGVLVIAATNRDDVLDPALLRAGRFDRKITVSLPDLKGREAIFAVHARGKNVDETVNFANLSKRTVGFSGADIEAVLNDAAILSVRENKSTIGITEIDEAIDRRIGGPAKSSRSMTTTERRMIAFHEAGHAVIGLNLKDSDKVQKITIVPRGNTGGHVLMTPEQDRFLLTRKELFARIVGYLGGRSSEEVFFDDISTGASNDIEMATHIARLMVVEYGMSSLGPIQYEQPNGNVFLGRDYTNTSRNFSSDVAKAIDKEIRAIIDEAHATAVALIKEKKDDIILIAETLLEIESITSEQIAYLLEHRSLEGFVKPVVKPADTIIPEVEVPEVDSVVLPDVELPNDENK